MSDLLNQIKAVFGDFRVPKAEWARRDGVLLIATPSGNAVREDGVGRCVRVDKDELLLGRDDPSRLERRQRELAKLATDRLHDFMEIDRDDVVGRDAKFRTKPTRRSKCQVEVVDGAVLMPELFAVYRDKAGRRRFRVVVED